MTMTHKEAVKMAGDRLPAEMPYDEDLTTFLREYIEARGLVLVPRDATEKELRDIAAAARDFMTEDGLYPRAKAMRKAMLSAAPDPFEDGA